MAIVTASRTAHNHHVSADLECRYGTIIAKLLRNDAGKCGVSDTMQISTFQPRSVDSMPRRRSPLRCPICDAELNYVQIISLGAVTADLPWELHAGRCEQHGWFQAEVISKPPREIFPVTQPGGTARRFLIDGKPAYAFPTVWNSSDSFQTVDPYDARFWAVDWSRLPHETLSI